MPRLSAYQRHDVLAALAADQQDVASRAQLAGAGFDRHFVTRMALARRWQIVGLAVVLHGGEPSAQQRQWAAVLSAPRPAAIDGRAAARDYGLKGFACALLVASVQQRLITADMLQREILAAGLIRHRGYLVTVVTDIAGGADSLAEIDFTKIARRIGLPPPLRQSIRYSPDGKRRYLDADFGAFAVEVDGAMHLRTLNYWNDARRQNDLVIGGDRILRFPSIGFKVDIEAVEAQLRRAGTAFGLINPA